MNSRFKLIVITSSTCLVVMLLWGTVVGRSASPDETYRHLGVYTEVLSKIKSDYVEEPDIRNVTMGAVNGLLESLDPYSSYLNAEQYKQMYERSVKDSDKRTAVSIAARCSTPVMPEGTQTTTRGLARKRRECTFWMK